MYDLVVYHKGCFDGFGSAYAAWLALGDTAKYIPMSYYDRPPIIKNKKVLVCDFSFDENTTKKYIQENVAYYNIDHHIKAIDNLTSIPNKNKYFDVNHSGAYLTWKYFFPDKPVPHFIELIEDYDLWKFTYSETKLFIASLSLLPYNFKEWHKLQELEYLCRKIRKGKHIIEYQESTVNILFKHSKIKRQKIDGTDYNIAYANTSTLKNELGNKLAKEAA